MSESKIYDIEALKGQIIKKVAELKELRNNLENAEKAKLNFLIGKYYETSATSVIKITGINYIDDKSVNVDCKSVYGGKHCDGRIEVNILDEYSITIDDIEENSLREITQEQFNEFLLESIEITRKEFIKD